MLLRETLNNERKAGREEGLEEGRIEGRKEGLRDGIQQGMQESLIALLNRFGDLPDDFKVKIRSEKNMDKLNQWIRLAADVSSVEEFLKQM